VHEFVDTDDPKDNGAAKALPDTTRDPRDRRALFLTTWDTHPAACWTPDMDNLKPSLVGHANVNATAALRTIPSSLAPLVEKDVIRVHRMCYNRYSKGKKIFEYLVDKSSTWIIEDQLRISLSSICSVSRAKLQTASPSSVFEIIFLDSLHPLDVPYKR
jgi:hypothetical protein